MVRCKFLVCVAGDEARSLPYVPRAEDFVQRWQMGRQVTGASPKHNLLQTKLPDHTESEPSKEGLHQVRSVLSLLAHSRRWTLFACLGTHLSQLRPFTIRQWQRACQKVLGTKRQARRCGWEAEIRFEQLPRQTEKEWGAHRGDKGTDSVTQKPAQARETAAYRLTGLSEPV